MSTRDPRVDAYLAKQRPFAQPLLANLREIVHAACPDVVETMKWSSPFFDYNGQPLCNMAGFKEHVGFGFWKAPLITGLESKANDGTGSAGSLGRIMSEKDLPSKKVLTAFIKQAMKLNDEGTNVVKTKKAKPSLPVPPELTAGLARNKKAKAAFEAFPPGHRRDYCEWIGEAKREETKASRVKQAVEWIAEGKSRNWKYQR